MAMRFTNVYKTMLVACERASKKGPGEEPFFPLVSKREENSFEFSTLMKR